MALVIAVAIGLNPYVATLFLAVLAAFTVRLPDTGLLGVVPDAVWYVTVVLFGLAMPADFIMGKFVRLAPPARYASQLVAAASAALFAAGVTGAELPLPLVAALAAGGAWAVSAMVTALAARASRSPAWVGLGHIPVLMAAATAAACILPLGMAKPAVGVGLAVIVLSVLAWGAFASQPSGRQVGSTRVVRAVNRRNTRRVARTASGYLPVR